jgi:hypothetical protein
MFCILFVLYFLYTYKSVFLYIECEYQAQRLVACEHHEMMRVVRQRMSNYRTTTVLGLVAITIRPV